MFFLVCTWSFAPGQRAAVYWLQGPSNFQAVIRRKGLITSKFDIAINQPPLTEAYGPAQKIGANVCIASFLILATALGIAETEFVPERDKFAWRAMGAPIGMVQYWRVFAPDLRTINWHSTALIEFQDGSVKYYEFPRPEQMSLAEAFARAKERTFFFEQLANLNNRKMLPSIARFLARANFDAANPPVFVRFVFNSAPMSQPKPEDWKFIDEFPKHTASQIFFVYKVRPDDLKSLSSSGLKEANK